MKKRNLTLWVFTLLCCLAGTQVFAQVTVNMPFNTGVQQTFAITPPNTCSFNFFDNGGAAGNYSAGSNANLSVVTFAPSVATNKIQAAFSSFNTEANFDALYVRDGNTTASPLIPSANGAPLTCCGYPAGGWWGTVAPNNPPVSGSTTAVRATAANATGALTFSFVSDVFVFAGWQALVTEVLPVACGMTAPANLSVGTGAGAVDCAANVLTALPAFNPGGCASGLQLQYRVNGGAPIVIPQPPLPATLSLPGIPVGINTIAWQLVNPCGGAIVSQVIQTITVADNTPPVITCPASVTINLPPGECSVVYSYNVTWSDNCPASLKPYFAIPDTNVAIGFSSLSCGPTNHYYQVLAGSKFSAPVVTAKISVGIDLGYNPAAQLTFRLYTLNNPALPYNVSSANRTQIGTAGPFPIPPGSAGQHRSFPIVANIPAGATVLMEVQSNSTFTVATPPGTGTLTWFASPNCVVAADPNNPQPFNNLGGGFSFPLDMIAVLYGASPIVGGQIAGLPSGATFPIGTTTNVWKVTDAAGNMSTCSFNVTVLEFPNPIQSLVCNDLVQVSLDKNCTAVIGADQVLEGGPYHCYDDYIVELDKTLPFGNGPWVPAVLGPGDVGKTYQVRVTDPDNGNKCWGNIHVEDKLPPVLVCPNVNVPCNVDALPGEIAALTAFNVAFPNLNIPAFGTASVNTTVNLPAGAPVTGLTVKFKTNHTWVGDIDAKLTAPNGQTIILFDRPGVPASGFGCANDGMDVVFDDGAALTAAQLESTCNTNPAIAGTFQPVNPIANLLSGNLNGTWTVTAQDFVGGDGGPTTEVVLQFSLLTAVPFPNGLVLNQNVFPTNTAGCYTAAAGAGTPVLEPCSDASLCYIDTEVPQNCASGLTKIVNRKWTATDASGNTATCIQQIRFERATINDVAYPPNYDDIDADAINCVNGGIYPTPAVIESQGNQGYPYVFGAPDGCSINWTYTDAVIRVCDGTYKILRKWTVIDWCTGTDDEHNQIIKVLDNSGPAIACPANITVGTDPFTCCASADLPDVIVEDNCSHIKSVSAMVTVFDPQTNAQIAMHQFNGSLGNFLGNNLWDLDTMAVFGNTPCLPLGSHLVTYVAEDDCGNTSSCTFRVIVRDYTPPVAACDEFTVVGIGGDDPFDCYGPAGPPGQGPAALGGCEFAGVTWVKAKTFDNESYDNCGNIKFTVRRMDGNSPCIAGLNQTNGHPACDDFFPDFPSEYERAVSEGDSIKFYCCEVGTTQTVVLSVYQLDVNGNITVGPDGTPVKNECMVQVSVQDKIKPVCQSPANVTVNCENFDPSLWAYGKASVYDNCCLDTNSVYQGQCGLIHTVNNSLFDTVCNRGTITRTFRAIDCHGLSSQCTQRVFVTYEQDYFVRFPNDVIVTTCDGTGNFGEPTFFGEDCELLGVSHEDEVFNVVPDACYKIERTWTIINWCTYNPNLGCINVPNPNPNAILNHPSNLPGPIVSACGTPAPWNPTIVRINPTDPQPTNFCTFWDANANCYKYKQIIKVIDNQAPQTTCPASPVEICDVTPNDPLLWNASYWWDATTEQHDLCEAPTDLCITGTDLCSGADINIRYLLFLDLDGDGTMETVINSVNTGIAGLGWNAVPYGNANTPSYSGGTIRQFDGRPVLPNQKYGFAIQTTTSGTNKTACVRWNTQQSQNTYVVPELPYGTHKIKWFLNDNCGNERICEYTFVVKDCKAPTVVCINGLSVNIMPTKMIQLWASDFLQYTEDNCTPDNKIVIGIRRSGTGTGFPFESDGVTPQTSVTFTCDDLGTQLVELWAMDLEGNADYCETYVIVQDNAKNCENNSGNVAGALKTESSKGLEDAKVDLSGSHPALPPVNMFTMTDQTGAYNLAGIPLLGNYTVTPNKDNDPLNGVSTFDLVLINKHILGLEPLGTPYKMIAADANNSRSITTFDIVELRKLILGIYTELPNNTSWRFVDKGYNFPNANNPFEQIFPETKQYANMLASQLAEDFVSVKVGDVNDNAVTNVGQVVEDRTAGTLLFDVEDRAVKAGETFTVTFKATEQVQGYQFTMNFPNLEVVDVVPGTARMENFGVFAADHALTTSWNGKEQAEFGVTFRAKTSGQLSQMLGVSSRITRAEAYSTASERLQVAFRFNGQNGSTISGLGFELYQNQPNPFVSKTQIGFYLPQATEATLTIFDESGRTIFTQKGDYAKGYNAVTVDRAVVNTTGLLYYKLETATNSATRKMIQSK